MHSLTLQSSVSDDGEEESIDDEEGIVSVGDTFVYSDDEEGDSTLTVQRICHSITHGDIVYVEEDEETLCLSYVRKKVSETTCTDNPLWIRDLQHVWIIVFIYINNDQVVQYELIFCLIFNLK